MTWTTHELTVVDHTDELEIAPRRDDGTLRSPVPVWVVRDGDDLYVRSWRGRAGSWYRAAQASHEGHIRCGSVDKNVTFVEIADTELNDRVDTAYRTKYSRYNATYTDPMVAARDTTLKLVPR